MPNHKWLSLVVCAVAIAGGCDEGGSDPTVDGLDLSDEDAVQALPQTEIEAEGERVLPEAPVAEDAAAPLESRAALTGTWDYVIVSVASGKCMTVNGGSTQTGAYIRQEDCVFDASQRFDRDGQRWRNIGSGLCVDSAIGWLTQQPCGPWSTQEFVPVGDGTGSEIDYVREDNRYWCWDVPWGTNNAYYLQSYPCNGGFNQDWIILRVF